MALSKEFSWNKREHSVKGFIQGFSHKLPLIVTVTQGYCGVSDYYEYSAGEIYRIREVKRYTKLLFKDSEGRFFSVPKSYQFKFHLCHEDGKRDSAKLLSELANQLESGMTIEVEENSRNQFRISILGQDKDVSLSLGVLQYEDFYEESCLIGNALIDGEINENPIIAIPDYVDIHLSLANGLVGGTIDDFDKVRSDIGLMCQGFKPKSVTMIKENSEIMLVKCDPESLCEEYERVTPIQYLSYNQLTKTEFDVLKKNQQWQASLHDGTTDNELYSLKPPPQVPARQKSFEMKQRLRLPAPPPGSKALEKHKRSLTTSHEIKESSGTATTLSRSSKLIGSKTDPDSDPDYVKPDSYYNYVEPVQVAPPQPRKKSSDKTNQDVFKHEYINKVNQVKPMVRARKIHYEEPDAVFNETQTQFTGSNTGYISMDKKATFDMARHCKPPPMLANLEQIPLRRPEQISPEESSYGDFSELPQSLKEMTVQQVANCLTLLKFDKYVNKFKEEDIDGDLLCSIDQNMLIESFGFNKFEAKKLLKFVHEGWRPNSSINTHF